MATRATSGDPRVTLPRPGEESVLPTVTLPRAGPSWVVVAIAIAVAALLLFAILDSRRRAAQTPEVPTFDQGAVRPPPPPLVLPPEQPPALAYQIPPQPLPPAPPAPAPQPRIVYVPQPAPPAPPAPEPPPAPPRASNAPTLVVDTSAAGPAPAAGAAQSEGGPTGAAQADTGSPIIGGGQQTGRVRAGVLANRATTVPQGTLIQAVLETAFDSTRPGFARAIVSRDIRGFDGTRVLIPRGSRLIGEYRSDAAPGQRRALINWFRLIRPDGITIAIGSPAADPLGRGGVRARVNSHFFERFAGAILQSALDVGVNLASRAGDGTVIVGLPGTVQGTSQLIQPAPIVPTLTVPAGRSVSIFVARDLDFTGVGNRR